MTGTKSIWASKGVWGGVVALLAAVLMLFNITLSEADQSALVEAAVVIAAAIGSVLSIYGRVVATHRIE